MDIVKKQKVTIALVALVILGLGLAIAPYIIASQYNGHAHAVLVQLRDDYAKARHGVEETKSQPKEVQLTATKKLLEPFEVAKRNLSRLLQLGFIANDNTDYQAARQLEKDVRTLIDQGAAYSLAEKQLLDFYGKMRVLVKKYPLSNAETVDGLRSAARTYHEASDLRKKTVTSPLLADPTNKYVEVIENVARLYEQKSTAIASGDHRAIAEANARLTKAGYAMTALAFNDSPEGFADWSAGVQAKLDKLVAAP